MNQDRFKFRTWDQKNKKMEYDAEWADGATLGTLGEQLEEPNYVIEQCTGLKDKNGNLIYEGDVLKCESKRYDSKTGEPFIVYNVGAVKREPNGKYYIESDFDKTNYFYGSDITFYNERAEIIGNIHESKGE